MSFFPAGGRSGEVRSLRVAVIGAGIAGLTAAYRLKSAGFQVVVLERQAGVGGRMAVRTESGIEYNTGARLVYSFSDDLLALADQVGLASHRVPVEHANATIQSGGADHQAFFAPSPGIIRSPFVTLGQLPALTLMGSELLVRQARRDPNDLTAGRLPDGQTMREYLEKRGLATVGKFLLEPVFRAARGWSLDDVSPAFFLSTSAAMWRGKPLTFEDGMGMLTSRLEDHVEVATGVEVTEIDRGTGHELDSCTITCQRAGETQRFKADIVVVAVEGSVAASIIPEQTPAERRWFSAVRYNSGGILHYHLDRHLPAALRLFGPGENQLISLLETKPGPDGGTHVSLQLSPEGVQAAIQQGLQDDIERLLEGSRPDLVVQNMQHVRRRFDQWIPNQLPIIGPGYVNALRQFRQQQSVNASNCYYAGDYMAQALLGGACRSGRLAADAIVSHWGQSGDGDRN